MPRLIDADTLQAIFSNMTIFGYGDYVSGQKMMLDTIIDYIDAAPTIDPEKHSQWEYWAGGLLKCPICGHEYIDRLECSNYCPNCGCPVG